MTDSGTTEIEFDQTAGDLRRFQRYHARTHNRRFMVMAVVLACVFIGLPLGMIISFASEQSRTTIAFIPWPIFLTGVAYVFFFVSRLRLIRRQALSMLQGPVGVHRRVVLTPQTVQIVTPKSDARYQWSGIMSIEEDATHMYFYLTPAYSYVIPKRAFVDPAAARAFITLARQYHQAANLK